MKLTLAHLLLLVALSLALSVPRRFGHETARAPSLLADNPAYARLLPNEDRAAVLVDIGRRKGGGGSGGDPDNGNGDDGFGGPPRHVLPDFLE